MTTLHDLYRATNNTVADLVGRLVAAGAREDNQLDYKQALTVATDDQKLELARDLSAFANARGGHLVFGAREGRRRAPPQRQELYLRIAEWVWNEASGPRTPRRARGQRRQQPGRAGCASEHAEAVLQSPGRCRQSREPDSRSPDAQPVLMAWCARGILVDYHVAQQSTRVELAISNWEKQENKAIFDRLVADRERIEAEYGGMLDWQRLNDNIVSKVGITVHGGWADESTFDATEKAVVAMKRLYGTLGKRAKAAREPSA